MFAPSAKAANHRCRPHVPGHLPSPNSQSPFGGDFDLRTEEPHQKQRSDHQSEYLEEVAELTDDAEGAAALVGQDQDDTAEARNLRRGNNRGSQFDNRVGLDSHGQEASGVHTINSNRLTEPLRQFTHLIRGPASGSNDTHRPAHVAGLES